MDLPASAPTHTLRPAQQNSGSSTTELRSPQLADAPEVWRLIANTAELDLNSSYAYLLWCRDFADSSIVAVHDGAVRGFISGYLRPSAPDTLFVWQVAVDAQHRGQGLASRMLHGLLGKLGGRGVRWIETTVTADNRASNQLFASFARSCGVTESLEELFSEEMYPDQHATELLHRIGPLATCR